MSSHDFEHEGDSKKFTVTAIMGFVAVFVFLLLMSTCHGPFKPEAAAEHAPAAEHAEK